MYKYNFKYIFYYKSVLDILFLWLQKVFEVYIFSNIVHYASE